MAVAKKPVAKKAAGTNGTAKKGAVKGKSKPSVYKWPGVWMTDPDTGEMYQLFLHRPTGKGTIPLKDLRAAVRKVRDERLAREKVAAESAPTE